MTAYRLTESAPALPTQPVEGDCASGCGVMRGALLGALIWASLFALYTAF